MAEGFGFTLPVRHERTASLLRYILSPPFLAGLFSMVRYSIVQCSAMFFFLRHPSNTFTPTTLPFQFTSTLHTRFDSDDHQPLQSNNVRLLVLWLREQAMILFNFAGAPGCWIHHNDDNVTDAFVYEILFSAVPIAVSFVVVLFTMCLLYCTVRRQESRTRKYLYESRLESANVVASRPSETESPSESVAEGETTTPDEFRRRRERLPLTSRTRDAGLLYSLSFLVVNAPMVLLANDHFLKNAFDWYGNSTYHKMRCAAAVLGPIQGCFNMLIYTLPVWYPKMSQLWGKLRGTG